MLANTSNNISVSPNTNGNNITVNRTVKYKETISFNAVYDTQHTIDYWNASTSPSQKPKQTSYTYDEIIGTEFKLILNSDYSFNKIILTKIFKIIPLFNMNFFFKCSQNFKVTATFFKLF